MPSSDLKPKRGKISVFLSFCREAFWPISKGELKKVLSLFLLLFLLCNCYSVLRNLKDTCILNAQGSGAEILPFIKVWGVLPGAILGTLLYTKLCNMFSREKVTYIILSSFIGYFLVFATLLYPNREVFYLESVHNWMTSYLPVGFSGLSAMIANWMFTIFYVICELWAVLILTIIFWGFANDVTKVDEAKRFYGVFNIGSNLAPIIGGYLGILITDHGQVEIFGLGSDPWGQTLFKMVMFISAIGIIAMLLFYWINRKVLPGNPFQVQSGVNIKKKKRLSIRESIREISGSKYLLALSFIVLGFSIAINMTDVLWKSQLKNLFTDPNAMNNHMNRITIWIGVIGTIGGFVFSFLIRRMGWRFVALLTPMAMALLGLGFFTFLFAGDKLIPFAGLFGVSPLFLTVYFGSMQNCLSKAGKYSVFDASKEMAFLPLDSDQRMKGKAAIDGLGSGMGKSGASLIYQFFLLTFGSIVISMPYIAVLLAIVLCAWIASVFYVGKGFNSLTAEVPQPI